MLYQTFNPPPRLAPYVRFFWALEDNVGMGEEFVHRSMADGCVEIVFHYRAKFDEIGVMGEGESPLSNIQAQSTGFRRFSTRESFGIFGAYLYPFAIPRLFSFPASDLQIFRRISSRFLEMKAADLKTGYWQPPITNSGRQLSAAFLKTSLTPRHVTFR